MTFGNVVDNLHMYGLIFLVFGRNKNFLKAHTIAGKGNDLTINT